MYRLYGRKIPVNEATRSFVDTICENILSVDIREKKRLLIHRGWDSHILNGLLHPSILLKNWIGRWKNHLLFFFKGAIYEFTYNKYDEFSPGQMSLLYDIPDQQTVAQSVKVKVLAAPTGYMIFSLTIQSQRMLIWQWIFMKLKLTLHQF